MSHIVVGHCPKCGAPVYSPSSWSSVLPPPSTPSCTCSARVEYSAQTTDRIGMTIAAAPLTEADVRRIIREELAPSAGEKP
jgi:hypothetical protein